jgi:hypothetical protein
LIRVPVSNRDAKTHGWDSCSDFAVLPLRLRPDPPRHEKGRHDHAGTLLPLLDGLQRRDAREVEGTSHVRSGTLLPIGLGLGSLNPSPAVIIIITFFCPYNVTASRPSRDCTGTYGHLSNSRRRRSSLVLPSRTGITDTQGPLANGLRRQKAKSEKQKKMQGSTPVLRRRGRRWPKSGTDHVSRSIDRELRRLGHGSLSNVQASTQPVS